MKVCYEKNPLEMAIIIKWTANVSKFVTSKLNDTAKSDSRRVSTWLLLLLFESMTFLLDCRTIPVPGDLPPSVVIISLSIESPGLRLNLRSLNRDREWDSRWGLRKWMLRECTWHDCTTRVHEKVATRWESRVKIIACKLQLRYYFRRQQSSLRLWRSPAGIEAEEKKKNSSTRDNGGYAVSTWEICGDESTRQRKYPCCSL